MDNNVNKYGFWISTALLSLMMLFSAGMYIAKYAEMSTVFKNLGYPTYIIYPLAVVKILGIIVLLTRRNSRIAEWAYAGFFFDFILALSAHINVKDGEYVPAVLALFLLSLSYFFRNRYLVTT